MYICVSFLQCHKCYSDIFSPGAPLVWSIPAVENTTINPISKRALNEGDKCWDGICWRIYRYRSYKKKTTTTNTHILAQNIIVCSTLVAVSLLSNCWFAWFPIIMSLVWLFFTPPSTLPLAKCCQTFLTRSCFGCIR